MSKIMIEHANITVSDVEQSATMLQTLFGWKIRWQGAAKDNGQTAHVGDESQYLALYSKGGDRQSSSSYETPGRLNHIGIVVDDLDAMEVKVRALGLSRTTMQITSRVGVSISGITTISNSRLSAMNETGIFLRKAWLFPLSMRLGRNLRALIPDLDRSSQRQTVLHQLDDLPAQIRRDIGLTVSERATNWQDYL